MKNQFGQNTNEDISALEVYYFKVNTKRESMFCLQEDTLFCSNLEVVNFQGRNLRNIFVDILSKLIFHKDILKLTDL